MATFKVPVSWRLTATVDVEADSLDDAIEAAYELEIPKDGEYLDDSFEVEEQLAEEMNADDDKDESAEDD